MNEILGILVVEDDAALRDAVCLTLECAGHRVVGVEDGPSALQFIDHSNFNVVVSDLKMEPMDGLQLLAEIRRRDPSLPVLLMTAFGDVDKAVAAMRGGACDFLMKPFEPSVLLQHVQRYAFVPPEADGVIAVDPRTRQLLSVAARVAGTDATVLLTGESGTGKEVFARYIHRVSARRDAPFVAINCAAIPENLLEATLFGYEKGAFTGAQAAQAGKFEQAEGGTLLLDEISEMPLSLQVKLLRVLQEREVERVGGRKPIRLDIRVIATSNRDMAGEVAKGRFREDLYYRLNVFPLVVPALRQRPQDIAPLARHFVAVHGARCRRSVKLSAAAEAVLAVCDWPGNVRELENAVQRTLILAPGDAIEPEHLHINATQPRLETVPSSVESAVGIEPTAEPIATSMKDLERHHIMETLAAVGGSRKLAVQRLGISERTLRYKLQQYRSAQSA